MGLMIVKLLGRGGCLFHRCAIIERDGQTMWGKTTLILHIDFSGDTTQTL